MTTLNFNSSPEANSQALENLYVTSNGGGGNTIHTDHSISSIYTWDQFMNELEFE